MGNFLAILPSSPLRHEGAQTFLSGLGLVRRLKGQPPSSIIETEWVRAASFSRRNGSGTPIVIDAPTGCWLLAIGTWFHNGNYGSGGESHLLRSYLEVGAARLARELEGFFVIVIGDARTRETIILTDLVGSCHCFVRMLPQGIALSGSSLLLAGLGDFDLDPVGCQEFLCTGILYEDRTLYHQVRKLTPASIYCFAEGRLKSQRRYWRITDITPDSLDGQPAIDALWEGLVLSAQKISRIFPRPVCDLTGGYDSRVLVAAFRSAGVPFATTVTGPAESPDVVVSRGLAGLAGLPHLHLNPQGGPSFERIKMALALTDGEYDLVEYAHILDVHQSLAARFDISINGSFGEVARGYWWELLWPHAGARRPLDVTKVARRRYAAQGFDPSWFLPAKRFNLVAHLAGVIERTNEGLQGMLNTAQMDHAYLVMRMQRWQGRIASSTNRLWPCLSPFLFRSVLETMLQIASPLRRNNRLIRKMLARYQPRLAEYPLEHGYPALPFSWKNFPRFWPLPVHLGQKVLRKGMRLAGKNRSRGSSGSDRFLPRLRLWEEEEVKELLRPEKTRLGRFVDPLALADFLRRSQQEDFPYGGQWARLLTMEYALSVLSSIKKMQGDEV